jgi:hypothetical protein
MLPLGVGECGGVQYFGMSALAWEPEARMSVFLEMSSTSLVLEYREQTNELI